MKATKFSQLFLVFFVICAVSQTAFAQQLRRLSDLQVPTGPPKSEQQRLRMPGSLREIENGTGRAIEQSNANGDSRRSFVDGTAELKRRQKERGERVSPQSTQNTIPYWSDSFSYQGLEFKYKMVGTDPKKGSKTTVIPTVIIPLRFVFPDGQVFDASTDLVDGQTPVQGIVNSPIFQNYSFVLNGTSVGTTQYGDAFQRANFWDSVSTRAQNYHVLLGQPVITATQTIDVPPGMASYDFDSFSGETVPVVEDSVLFDLIEPVLTNTGVTPDVLPIMVWGRVVGFNPLGFHGITTLKGNTQTLIGASYGPQTRFGGFGADTYPLSHEVIEWMDDPFIDNFTPGWNVPFILPRERCDSGSIVRGLLEVGDPVAFFHEAVVNLPGASYDYHVTEAMFIDFYTRSPRSRSVNGQYSMFTIGAPFGLPSEPSSPCIGSVQANERHIDVPGSFITFARGLNNQSDVVGYYVDPQNRTRGFLWKDGTFADINFPQASATLPFKINDSGEIVGYFFDGSGRQHGFSYAHGQWTRIDYPGARATVALGINSAGLIVGAFRDATQPIVRGFTLFNGQFMKVDPFALHTEVDGINDLGQYVGFACSDVMNGPCFGFVGGNNQFSLINMPGAQFTEPETTNNDQMIAGNFDNGAEPYSSGFVRLFGYLHEVNVNGAVTYVYGNNDLNQIAGDAYDFNAQRWVGYIGDLPITKSK